MMPAHNFHCGLFPALAETTRAWYPMVRVGALCAVGFASGLIAGCGELEPVREPERVEFELTTDTLQASVRDAQRMMAELRRSVGNWRKLRSPEPSLKARSEKRNGGLSKHGRSSSSNGKNWPQFGPSGRMRSKGAFHYRVGRRRLRRLSHERDTQVLCVTGRRRSHFPPVAGCRFLRSTIRHQNFLKRLRWWSTQRRYCRCQPTVYPRLRLSGRGIHWNVCRSSPAIHSGASHRSIM